MTLDMLSRKHCKIRVLASFVGSLISVCPGVQYGILHTKLLEREKFLAALAVANDNFGANMPLPYSIREDLLWWKAIFSDTSQRNKIRSGSFELFTDASLSGWGAVCANNRTHGFWSEEEKPNHINYLELLAVFHGLRCFASDFENMSNILLRVDNSTALSYINCMGSIKFPHLSDLARKIWSWCAEQNLFIYASYIPSAQNFVADAESRVVSEWSLDIF